MAEVIQHETEKVDKALDFLAEAKRIIDIKKSANLAQLGRVHDIPHYAHLPRAVNKLGWISGPNRQKTFNLPEPFDRVHARRLLTKITELALNKGDEAVVVKSETVDSEKKNIDIVIDKDSITVSTESMNITIKVL